MGVIRNCCPVCGSPIEVSALWQYSLNYKILRNGKISQKSKKKDVGPMEVAIAGCTNENCDVNWAEGEFRIDENKRFIDEKYDEE